MEAMKPCPFCGAAGRLDYDPATGFFGPDADHEPGCLLQNWDMRDYADEHDAVADWNRRAPNAPPNNPQRMESA